LILLLSEAVSKTIFADSAPVKFFPNLNQSFGGNMLIKSKITRVVCAVFLTFSMTILAFADTIRLKDGSVIKGKIVSFGGGKFTVVIGDGTRTRQLNFNASEVESILFDSDTNGSGNSGSGATTGNAGQTNRINLPQTSSPRTNEPVGTNRTNQTSNDSAAKPEPVKVNVKVLADNSSNGWTNSGWVVQKGQKIRIVSSGRVSLGGGRFAAPGGVVSLPDTGKLMPNEATGGLIAVVGDDNNEFIFVGDSREFTATRDGALFLGVNEGNLADNSGVFDVRIEIDPSK